MNAEGVEIGKGGSSCVVSAEEAMCRIQTLLSHAWMVRTFLKHAEDIAPDDPLQDVHRVIFDYCRALEPAWQRNDAEEYVRRARGKLAKLRRASHVLASEYARVSTHTNFQMAAQSLLACVTQIEMLLASAPSPSDTGDRPERSGCVTSAGPTPDGHNANAGGGSPGPEANPEPAP